MIPGEAWHKLQFVMAKRQHKAVMSQVESAGADGEYDNLVGGESDESDDEIEIGRVESECDSVYSKDYYYNGNINEDSNGHDHCTESAPDGDITSVVSGAVLLSPRGPENRPSLLVDSNDTYTISARPSMLVDSNDTYTISARPSMLVDSNDTYAISDMLPIVGDATSADDDNTRNNNNESNSSDDDDDDDDDGGNDGKNSGDGVKSSQVIGLSVLESEIHASNSGPDSHSESPLLDARLDVKGSPCSPRTPRTPSVDDDTRACPAVASPPFWSETSPSRPVQTQENSVSLEWPSPVALQLPPSKLRVERPSDWNSPSSERRPTHFTYEPVHTAEEKDWRSTRM
jgi:hypothetical protein